MWTSRSKILSANDINTISQINQFLDVHIIPNMERFKEVKMKIDIIRFKFIYKKEIAMSNKVALCIHHNFYFPFC